MLSLTSHSGLSYARYSSQLFAVRAQSGVRRTARSGASRGPANCAEFRCSPLEVVRDPASAAATPPPPRPPPLGALVRRSSSFVRSPQLDAVLELLGNVGLRTNGASSRHSPRWSGTARAVRWSSSDAPAPERARAGEPAPLIGAEGVGGDGTLRSVAVQRVVVAQLYKHHEDMHRRRQRGATRGQLERAGSEPGARRGGGGAIVGRNLW